MMLQSCYGGSFPISLHAPLGNVSSDKMRRWLGLLFLAKNQEHLDGSGLTFLAAFPEPVDLGRLGFRIHGIASAHDDEALGSLYGCLAGFGARVTPLPLHAPGDFIRSTRLNRLANVHVQRRLRLGNVELGWG